MRTSNLEKVKKALTTRASSAPELKQRTGLSYNTVSAALSELQAVKVPDTYPAVWALPTEGKQMDQVVTPTMGYLLVPDIDEPLSMERWNNALPNLGSVVGSEFIITEESDIGELAKRYRKMASLLAHQAQALEIAAQHPDAYARLGGTPSGATPFS